MSNYDREDQYVPLPKYGPKFTAEDVRKLRDEKCCGMYEAKELLMRQQMLEDLRKGRNGLQTSVIYDILEYLLENKKL